jgi:hypothetical protein
MRLIRKFPLSTLLFAIFPVLSLYAHNIDQMRGAEIYRALIIASVGGLILVLIFRLLIRDWYRAALCGSLSVLLFSSYGHIYSILKQVSIFNFLLGRHRYLVPLWILLFAAGLYVILKKLVTPRKYVNFSNLLAILLLVLPVFEILSFEIKIHNAQTQVAEDTTRDCELSPPKNRPLPDVYYIILDAYAREDTLLQSYQFDNSAFLDFLREKGFYIADWSQTNYLYTFLSLASSLNMNYLEELDERITPGAPFDRGPIYPFLGQSIVRRNLECLGYEVVTFDTGFHITGWLDADIYISSETSAYEAIEITGRMNAFESLLLRNSAALFLIDSATILPRFMQLNTNSPFQQHYDQMIFQFDALEQIVPSIEGPKFVFAHILATHTPYVIGPEGEFIDSEGQFSLMDLDTDENLEQVVSNYQDQVAYVNQRMERIIDEILGTSQNFPILLLQSDHGPEHSEDRIKILNAYYLPEDGHPFLYKSISPVNSFRVIFNYAFGSNYPLLEDLSYASPYETFDFELVPNPHSAN